MRQWLHALYRQASAAVNTTIRAAVKAASKQQLKRVGNACGGGDRCARG
jgi:hypothetical protein